jgi:ABC-type amino acid transport substrate-binding protein
MPYRKIMADSMGSTPPSPLKKKGMNKLLIAAIAIIVVVVLIAVVVLGGFLNGNDESNDALQKIKDRGTLIVGTNVPWAPFEEFNLTSGQYEGVDIDVITKVAESLGVKVEFRSMAFDALIGAVQAGQIDIAISSFTITEERAKSIDFSTAYYDANQAALVHDGSTIANIDGLNGTTVGSQLGTTGSFWVTDNLVNTGRTPASNVNEYDDIIVPIQLVENQQKDVVILDTPVANKYANDANYNLKVGFVIPTDEHYGIVCPKDQAALLNAVNDAINDMKADGSLAAIITKWQA